MMDERLKRYVQSLIPPREEKIMKLEEVATNHNVPIMDVISIEVLLQLLTFIQPKRILEIGTAIGYSAIRMAKAIPEATVITIERDEERYKQALANISDFGLEQRINVLFGDALQVMKELEQNEPFDVLFIDAAKGQYKRFFEQYSPLIKTGGVIFTDNVLFRGFVSAHDEEIPKRLLPLVKKLRHYNEWIMEHPNFKTTILPVGDGVAISIKKKNNLFNNFFNHN